ncbi:MULTISPECIES: MAG6790 family protein [unclassified Mycoplasma]|uniref:MAG6790 family protein n=1 Tax=unclassified Mycoplasma TaxID=2683645 RepID=UPI000FDF19A9
MYQYRARLKSSQEIIAESHTLENIEHQITAFRRAQLQGKHTKMNEPVEVIHIFRNKKQGTGKEVLVKIV